MLFELVPATGIVIPAGGLGELMACGGSHFSASV